MRQRALLLALVLIMTACGGGDGDSGGETRSLDPVVEAGAAPLVERWGDEDAFYVTLSAFDLGYSTEQILDADGGIEADGTIQGVDPVGPPLGMLSPTGPDGEGSPQAAVIVVVAAAGPMAYGSSGPSPEYVLWVGSTTEEIFQAARTKLDELKGAPSSDETQSPDEAQPPDEARPSDEAPGRELTVTDVVLGLAAQGYSLDQILEAIVFGEFDAITSSSTICFAVFDGASWAPPAGEPIPGLSPDCTVVSEEGPDGVVDTGSGTTAADTATTDPEAEGDVRVYRGTAEFQLTAYLPQGRAGTNFCETSGPAEMVVFPDGTLTLSVTWTEWVWGAHVAESGCRPYSDLNPAGGGSFTSVRSGVWSGSTFGAVIADPVNEDFGTGAQFEGDFEGDRAVEIGSLEFDETLTTYVRVAMALEMTLVDGG